MIKNVVFDLGGVVVGRDFPRLAELAGEAFSFIAGNDFPEYWAEFDRGIYTREEVTQMLANDRYCSIEEADRDIQNLLELLQEVPETVELIKELKAAGYGLYVLSNMSVEFFAHLKTFPVFEYFDGCTVSCYEHINKPDAGIYKALLHNHSLKAEECLFLDDKSANTAAAEALGFNTITFDQSSIAEVRHLLGLDRGLRVGELKEEVVPTNEIWYESVDGNIVDVEPNEKRTFGAKLISNTYADGRGVLAFDGEVTVVGDSAFYYAENLKSIALPAGVHTIGKKAFIHCYELERVSLLEGVAIIDDEAFDFCNKLRYINLPISVVSIGHSAFSSCWSLDKVVLPEYLSWLGVKAFSVHTDRFWANPARKRSVYCRGKRPAKLRSESWSFAWHDTDMTLEWYMYIYVPTESVEAYKTAEGWSDYAEFIRGFDY